jgi:threonine/homoserine/homoserine lactone efflux protein
MGSQFSLFLFASIVLVLAPGQDTIYVITRGIGQGKAAGVISALGVCSGTLIHNSGNGDWKTDVEDLLRRLA